MLTRYHLLGRTGLRVSPLALGAMTFNEDPSWGADKDDSWNRHTRPTELALTVGKPIMRIAVIGPSWGAGLGRLFARSGHPVVFASRNVDKAKSAANHAGDGIEAADVFAAVDDSEIVVVVVPFDRYPDIARDAGTALRGKVVIDTSSPINWRSEEPEIMAVPDGLTGAQHQQLILSPAKVVKAFNYIYGTGNLDALADRAGDQRVAVPLAGDDDRAKQTVATLITSVGFVAVDIGGLGDAYIIEPPTFDDWLSPVTEVETRDFIEARR